MRRGFSLPAVLAICLFFFATFVALSHALSLNRQRTAQARHQQAAIWLSVSGADLAQARLAKGELKAGETLTSPQFQQGSFQVITRNSGGGVLLESTGTAGGQTHVIRRTVRAR
jgi:hypothetical protein